MMRIAFQGAPGAYSEMAAQRAWPGVETVSCEHFEDVFASVAAGRTSHGLLPIENSIGGSIHRNYDLLLEHDLPIVAETELQVVHHLIAFPGTELSQIRRVCSHPQALAQCEQFLRKLPNVEIIATYDTAGSARMIRDQRLTDTAAVASARAAEIFELTVLQGAIQDYRDNITRFLLVARDPQALGIPDKTSLVFALPNAPGALFKALSVFALRDIDLTKLESRPMRGRPWEYLFYVDLAESARWVKTLGSYARWNEASMRTLVAEASVDVSAV
jgi:arogenate/prephenate dehydratase